MRAHRCRVDLGEHWISATLYCPARPAPSMRLCCTLYSALCGGHPALLSDFTLSCIQSYIAQASGMLYILLQHTTPAG